MGGKVPITKSEMLTRLAESTNLKKKDVSALLDAQNDLIAKQLKKDKKFKLPGLGIFAVRHRKARKARNPQTGAIINVKAKTVLKFRVAKDLKDKVL
jgi:DNA-binding protein HU-beta